MERPSRFNEFTFERHLTSVMNQTLLVGKCDCCKKEIVFDKTDVDSTVPCPICKRMTLLLTDWMRFKRWWNWDVFWYVVGTVVIATLAICGVSVIVLFWKQIIQFLIMVGVVLGIFMFIWLIGYSIEESKRYNYVRPSPTTYVPPPVLTPVPTPSIIHNHYYITETPLVSCNHCGTRRHRNESKCAQCGSSSVTKV